MKTGADRARLNFSALCGVFSSSPGTDYRLLMSYQGKSEHLEGFHVV